MKPTKMRNARIYRADNATKSRQLAGMLSKDLRKKYSMRSVRIIEGDTVTIMRGEYRNVVGRVQRVDVASSTVTIEGIQKEKTRGDKFDVKTHTSNLMITSVNTADKRRREKWGITETSTVQEEPGAQTEHTSDEVPGRMDKAGWQDTGQQSEPADIDNAIKPQTDDDSEDLGPDTSPEPAKQDAGTMQDAGKAVSDGEETANAKDVKEKDTGATSADANAESRTESDTGDELRQKEDRMQ